MNICLQVKLLLINSVPYPQWNLTWLWITNYFTVTITFQQTICDSNWDVWWNLVHLLVDKCFISEDSYTFLPTWLNFLHYWKSIHKLSLKSSSLENLNCLLSKTVCVIQTDYYAVFHIKVKQKEPYAKWSITTGKISHLKTTDAGYK
jgi:hypothetical protein